MQIAKRRNPGSPFAEGPIHLTLDGKRRLEERLVLLKKKLPDLALEAQRTAAYGDRSENEEYKQAKSILRSTQRQIWTIEDQLKRVVIIAQKRNPSGIVELGCTVVVETKPGVQKTYEVVGAYETNPGQGRISNQSPLGAALMYRATGDVVEIKTPSGVQKYRIIEVR